MKTYKINGREFQIVPDMTVERFGDLTDLFDLMVDNGEVSLDKIREFATNSKNMTELMSLALVPTREYGFLWQILKTKRKLYDLKHITLDQFIEVIVDFFGISGPLQTAFLSALSQMPTSTPTPSTGSAPK